MYGGKFEIKVAKYLDTIKKNTSKEGMILSTILEVTDVEIMRDGDFDSLGFVTHNRLNQLVFLEDLKFLLKLINNQNISCVITTKDLVEKLPNYMGIAIAENPREIFYKFHNFLATETDFYWKGFPTEISNDAEIDSRAYVAEKNVRIGNAVVVEPGALILERSIIEDDAIIGAGTVIGSKGFEFTLIGKSMMKIHHGGGVLLRRRVEVQSNCCIDRSVFGGLTELGEDTKLDNLVHIAHNVIIGKRCRLAACAMIAGSVTIGDDVWVGPGTSVSSEVKIGDGANVTIGSVVTKDIEAGQRVTGNFAIAHDKFIHHIKKISRDT